MQEKRKYEFINLFNQKVLPHMAQCEEERHYAWLKILIITILTTLVWIIIAYFFMLEDTYSTKQTTAVLLISAVCGGVIGLLGGYHLINRAFIKHIKSKYINTIISYFNNMKWFNANSINSDHAGTILKTNPVFAEEEIYDICMDDYFTGEYINIKYKIKELEFYYRTSEYRAQQFKGIILDICTNLPEGIFICSKNLLFNNIYLQITGITLALILFVLICFFGAYSLNYGWNGDSMWFVGSIILLAILTAHYLLTYHRRQLFLGSANMIDYNNQYVISTDNSTITHNFITPELLDLMENIRSCFKSNGISLNTYKDNSGTTLSVIIPTNQNAFEIGSLLKPMNSSGCLNIFFSQHACILDLIDYVANLNNTLS